MVVGRGMVVDEWVGLEDTSSGRFLEGGLDWVIATRISCCCCYFQVAGPRRKEDCYLLTTMGECKNFG